MKVLQRKQSYKDSGLQYLVPPPCYAHTWIHRFYHTSLCTRNGPARIVVSTFAILTDRFFASGCGASMEPAVKSHLIRMPSGHSMGRVCRAHYAGLTHRRRYLLIALDWIYTDCLPGVDLRYFQRVFGRAVSTKLIKSLEKWTQAGSHGFLHICLKHSTEPKILPPRAIYQAGSKKNTHTTTHQHTLQAVVPVVKEHVVKVKTRIMQEGSITWTFPKQPPPKKPVVIGDLPGIFFFELLGYLLLYVSRYDACILLCPMWPSGSAKMGHCCVLGSRIPMAGYFQTQSRRIPLPPWKKYVPSVFLSPLL